MNKKSDPETPKPDEEIDSQKTCGIVMPISAIGEHYTEDHWRRVRKILQKAVGKAGLSAKLVWENSEVDVIHTAILRNIYENDVVVCDLSGLNPNVMLETGMRLSTRRPTVIVTDRVERPPFDVSTIGYIEYQKDLEFNATEEFIDALAAKIKSVLAAYEKGTYEPFVEKFAFETVTPRKIDVPAEQYLKEQIDSIAEIVKRIDRDRRSMPDPASNVARQARRLSVDPYVIRVVCEGDDQHLRAFEAELYSSGLVSSSTVYQTDDVYTYQLTPTSGLLRGAATPRIREIASQNGISVSEIATYII